MKEKEIKKMAVQVTKEIIVKFIEIGRISPTNFDQFFAPIYKEVLQTIATPISIQEQDDDK
ncbi:hypothetical protein JCM12298_08380 [Desulfothermus naphthae]